MTDSYLPRIKENPPILFLAPGRPTQSERAMRLAASGFNVIRAHGASDIYLMSGALHLPCAVLSDKVGPAVLRASAQAVRWQWPKAHILILGRVHGQVEDHLYDDSVVHESDACALITKLDEVAEYVSKQRFNEHQIRFGT